MKHKILSVLLVLAMLLTLLPMSVFATEPVQVAWSFQDGVLTVSEADVEVDIPDYTAAAPAPWTLADTESGYDPLSVTEIVIAEGVKSVGENAFAGLDNVTKITLPKSVTTVGAGALPTQMQALQIKFDESTTVSFDGTDAVVLPTEREGYASSWNGITLSRDTALVDAAIVFTPVTYTVTFAADGIPVDMTGMDNTFTVEDTTIDVPEVPAKTGYTAAWETYTLGASDLTVNAVYTPITYYATFMNGEDEVDKVEFTVETTALEEPAVPEKEGFNGAWESYTLGMEDITVHAVYTLATYTVTFEADGTVVGTDTYTIEDRSVTAPTVPAKAGYKAAWETYTLGASDLTVKAKYTPITYYATFA
ncbi:MAG: InlB B-repeat-containing protein, partial [Oscillospiraceae bacterium]|nr:InlB B-repeat-containing protein [Oscillospiraceae bacterium]